MSLSKIYVYRKGDSAKAPLWFFSSSWKKKAQLSFYGLLPSCISKQTRCSTTLNLFPPLHLVYVYAIYVCLWGGTEGVAAADWSCPHTQTCSSWQIKMNSVVFGSGSPFIIFHFAQRASRTSAAACHVKTLYQALTAPPMHARTHTNTHQRTRHAWLIHTRRSCSSRLPLTVLHMWRTYVVICLTSTALSTTPSTLCGSFVPRSSLVSLLVSNPVSLPALC